MHIQNERDFKGIWIPKEIYLASDLNWNEKILLVEIDSLDNDEGCFASNEYFANFLGISKGRVSKNISSLVEKGYVTTQIIYKHDSKEIEKRILHATIGYSRKRQEGIVVNDQDNNTIINNTINNTKNKKEKGGMNALIDNYTSNSDLKECLKDFIKMRAAKKKPMTDRALKMLLSELDKLASEDTIKIKILEQSILNSWQGVFPLKNYEKDGGTYGNGTSSNGKNSTDPFDIF